MISFFVKGDPKGQPRPRAFARGGHAGVYDPGTADAWKMEIRASASSVPAGEKRKDRPVDLIMTFYFRRPKNDYKKDGSLKPSAPTYHTIRPDVDNLAKAVMDAMTHCGFWKDDSQVIRLEVIKRWAQGNLEPGVNVELIYL